MSVSLGSLKKGETFAVYLNYSLNGAAEVFPSTDLTAQVRSRGRTLVSNLTIASTATPGRFMVSGDTTTWPEGSVSIDVRRHSGGVTTITDTIEVEMLRPVTM